MPAYAAGLATLVLRAIDYNGSGTPLYQQPRCPVIWIGAHVMIVTTDVASLLTVTLMLHAGEQLSRFAGRDVPLHHLV